MALPHETEISRGHAAAAAAPAGETGVAIDNIPGGTTAGAMTDGTGIPETGIDGPETGIVTATGTALDVATILTGQGDSGARQVPILDRKNQRSETMMK